MSIKSEKFPDEFEELFERFDSPERDKKDVAFLMLEEVEKKYKTLKAKNLLLFFEFNALKDSRDELLSALKVAAQESEGYVFNDTIERAQALNEKETK